MPECPVCRGRKTIKLPLYRPVSAICQSGYSMADELPQESSREYACPECKDTAPEAKVRLIQCRSSVQSEVVDAPDAIEAIKHSMAREMAEAFLKAGFIRLDKGETGDDYRTEITATLGVVSRQYVASLEERIAERQDAVARQVANAAAAGIRVWGSYYTGDDGSIQKAQAVDAVYEALKATLAAASTKRKTL